MGDSMTNEEKAREQSIGGEPLVSFFATGQPTIGAYSKDSLRNQFEAGAEWKEQQMIDKAAEWLRDQACYYSHWEWNGDTCENEIVVDTEKMVEDFREAMK